VKVEVPAGDRETMNHDDRAFTPAEALGIMTARTLENSHPALLGLLSPGTSVLDVGSGPGTLTAEIARRVDPAPVVGMDISPAMILTAEATHPPGSIPNLVFYRDDILESHWHGEFDVVNTTRVLQWIPDAARAVKHMARAAVPEGLVVALDFDHTRAEWSSPPEAWTRFYSAFLAWRAGGGLDNAVARRLPLLFEAAGLRSVHWQPQVTTLGAGDPDFFRAAGQWRMVAESRGRQMVSAGYITETERAAAFSSFGEWMTREDATQTLYEACIVARRCGTSLRPARAPRP
jgi:ubiquinone/menaquinone biosynthesis C-methylase UbiE